MLRAKSDKSELIRAIARVSHTIEKKSTSPMSGSVKISAFKDDDSGEGLSFYGTDSFNFAGTTAISEVTSEGEVIIGLSNIERILPVLNKGPVELIQNKSSMTIVSGTKRFRVPIVGTEYPREASPPDKSVTLPSSVVVTALRRVESCQEGHERPHMNGIMLQSGGDSLASYALSSSRAASSMQVLPENVHLPFVWSCFLPRQIIRSVYELAEESEELTFSADTAVYVTTDESMIGCQLPAVPFPDPSLAFSLLYTSSCTVLTSDLYDALRSMAASGDSDVDVAFSLSLPERTLELRSAAIAGTAADAIVSIPISHATHALEPSRPFMLGANLAREVLAGFGDKLTIGFSNDFGRFDSIGDDKFKGITTAIVMFRTHQ